MQKPGSRWFFLESFDFFLLVIWGNGMKMRHELTAENGMCLEPSWHDIKSVDDLEREVVAAWTAAAQAGQIAEDPELEGYYCGMVDPIESQPIEGLIQALLPESYARVGIDDGEDGRLFTLGTVQVLISGEVMFQAANTDTLADEIGEFCDDYPDIDGMGLGVPENAEIAAVVEFYLSKAD